MFHFNGSAMDLFYASFFVIGFGVVCFLVLIIVLAIIIGIMDRRKKSNERREYLDLFNDEKRKERLEDMISDARLQVEKLEQKLKDQKLEDTNGNKKENDTSKS